MRLQTSLANRGEERKSCLRRDGRDAGSWRQEAEVSAQVQFQLDQVIHAVYPNSKSRMHAQDGKKMAAGCGEGRR